jgi:flavin reductase (DIM6/NTAB) family NADH-FMN oxidoreductase RutF
MRIHLSNVGAVRLNDPADFRRLDVLVDPQSSDMLERAIQSLGRREDTQHIRVAPSVLRFLSGQGGQPEWEAGFANMLAYARQQGWIDEGGDVRVHLVQESDDAVVSAADFKAAMRALPAGICAVTTGQDEEVAGMIISSFTSVSAEPPMVGFFAHQASSFTEPLLRSGGFVANVLGEEHHAVMSQFLSAPQGPARFASDAWSQGISRMPVLTDALASLECDIVWTQALGTHHLIVGKVRKTTCSLATPMVHFNAATHRIAVLV